VGTELDRITQEKEELLRQLHFYQNENDRFKSLIDNKDNTDMTNQIMQEDLNKHREENMRLQDKLKEEEII
jgi:DNA invertase Pin-like site-specific DNA recombinase